MVEMSGDLHSAVHEFEPGLVSRFCFSWMIKIISNARRGILSTDELPLPRDLESERSNEQFSKNWDTAVACGRGAKLFRALWATFGWELVRAGTFKAVWSAFLITGAFFFVRSILEFVNGDAQYASVAAGWSLTAGFFLNAWLLGLSQQRLTYGCLKVGVKVKGALTVAVVRKALALASTTVEDTSAIISFVATDTAKIYDGIQEIHYLWTAPLEAATIMGLLGSMVHEYALPGVALVVVLYLLQYWFGGIIVRTNMSNAVNTQARGAIIQEVLTSMKVIKQYGWEHFFEHRIAEIRKREVRAMTRTALIKAINITLVLGTPPLAAAIIFSTFEFKTGRLTATIAFTSLSLFNIMRFPLVVLPKALRAVSEAYASISRLESFLTREVSTTEAAQGQIGVEMKDATFIYEGGVAFRLHVPNFTVRPGELVAVVGRTGSGKSSLVRAIMGRMVQTSGQATVGGRLLYVPPAVGHQSGKIQGPQAGHPAAATASGMAQGMNKGGSPDLSPVQKGCGSWLDLSEYLGDVIFLDKPPLTGEYGTRPPQPELCARPHVKDKAVVVITDQFELLSQCDRVAIMDNGDMMYFGKWSGEAENLLGTCLPGLSKLHAACGGDVLMRLPPAASPPMLNPQLTFSPTDLGKMMGTQLPGKIPMAQAVRILIREGGTLLFILAVVAFLVSQSTRQMSDYWIRQWTSDSLRLYRANTSSTKASTMYASTYWALVGGFILLVLIRGLTFYWHILRASQRLQWEVVHKVFHAQLKFFLQIPIGDLLVSFSKDQDIMDEMLPDALHYMAIYGVILAATTVLVSISIAMFSVFAGVLVIMTAVMLLLYLPAATQMKAMKAKTAGEVVTLVTEVLEGLNALQTHHQQDLYLNKVIRRVDLNHRAIFSGECLNAWLAFYCDLYGAILVLAVSSFAVAYRKSLGPAAVGLAFSNTLQMLVFYTWVVRGVADAISLLSATERIARLAKMIPQESQQKPRQKDRPRHGGDVILTSTQPTHSWPKKGHLVFRDVCVRYDPSLPWALNGVSFQLLPGDKVVVVGRKGSGKSTLLLALFRLVEAARGQILVDDVDVATLPLHQLRRGLSIVPQNPLMYSGTVRSNLDPLMESSDHDLWDVVRKVGLAELVNSLGGLDGKVSGGTGAQAWSPGEQQLCCLARAALRRVPILCLDEATAALDPHTELLAHDFITNAFQERTTLMIAHQMATVMMAGRVMVIHEGVVKEVGDPGTLLSGSWSWFSDLVQPEGPEVAASVE